MSFISCDKDNIEETSINTTSAEEIQNHILNGYWELDSYRFLKDSTYTKEQYYTTMKFLDDINYDMYHTKIEKFNTEPWFDKLKTIEDKTFLVRYMSETDYNEDIHPAYSQYAVAI